MMNNLNNPFEVPEDPFFNVWPPGDTYEPKLPPPGEPSENVKRQADLYAKAHFRDGNLKSSKRHTRKNKKMAKRKQR